MSDEAAFEEAFKLKAQQLLGILSSQNLAPGALQEVKAIFDKAKATYAKKQMEDAAVLVAQAIQRAKQG